MENARKVEEEKVEKAWQITQEHQQAAEVRREQSLREVMTASSKTNTARANKFAASYERMLKDFETKRDGEHAWREEKHAGNERRRTIISAPPSPTSASMARSLSLPAPLSTSIPLHRCQHHELNSWNLQRLKRANEHAEMQQRQRIAMKDQRAEDIKMRRKEAEKMRADVLKHSNKERSHIRDHVERAQAYGAEKMVVLIARMDPEPEVIDKVNIMLKDFGMEQIGGGAAKEDSEAAKEKR